MENVGKFQVGDADGAQKKTLFPFLGTIEVLYLAGTLSSYPPLGSPAPLAAQVYWDPKLLFKWATSEGWILSGPSQRREAAVCGAVVERNRPRPKRRRLLRVWKCL